MALQKLKNFKEGKLAAGSDRVYERGVCVPVDMYVSEGEGERRNGCVCA